MGIKRAMVVYGKTILMRFQYRLQPLYVKLMMAELRYVINPEDYGLKLAIRRNC